VIFAITDLLFSINMHHGYRLTDRYLMLNDIDKTGFNIVTLNGKEAVSEYARLLNISKEKYIGEAFDIGMQEPFGFLAGEKTLIKEVIPNTDKKTLHANFRIPLHSSANILKYDEKKTLNTELDLMSHVLKKYNNPIGVSLFCCCSGRRPLLDGKEGQICSALKKKIFKTAVFWLLFLWRSRFFKCFSGTGFVSDCG